MAREGETLPWFFAISREQKMVWMHMNVREGVISPLTEHRSVAKAISLLVLLRGFSQQGLAKQIGVSQGHLSQVLSGERVPSVGLCKKLCDALEVTFEELCAIALKEFAKTNDSVEVVEERLTKEWYGHYIKEAKMASSVE